MKIFTTENLRFEVENFQEVLALSIKLVPGIRCINTRFNYIKEISVPSETELPEKTFSTNNGIYIFRYNGDVYLRKSLNFSDEFESPFKYSFERDLEDTLENPFADKDELDFKEVFIGVPMSNGQIFEAESLRQRWEELNLFR